MKKLLAFLCSLVLALPCAALGEETYDAEKVLNLFTWELYVDDATLSQFEEKTGIKVNYTNFNSNEEMLMKLQGTAGGEYDVIIASDYTLNIARKSGLLQKLDKSLIPNWGNLDPVYLNQYFDPDSEYVVPYIEGTPLIVYDPAAVDFEITSYEDLWNESLADSVVVMDDARNIIGITLKTMGQSFNTTDDDILAQAKEKLMLLRPNIRAFNSDTPYNDLLTGECSVIYTYTSYVVMALQENPDLKVVYPKEGLGIGIDGAVIPSQAPHVKNAHAFLDFILDGQIAAQIAKEQLFVCPVAAAKEYIGEDILNNPALYIPSELLVGAEYIQDLGEYESVYQSIWTDFKLSN